jgi:hypothetical protein
VEKYLKLDDIPVVLDNKFDSNLIVDKDLKLKLY